MDYLVNRSKAMCGKHMSNYPQNIGYLNTGINDAEEAEAEAGESICHKCRWVISQCHCKRESKLQRSWKNLVYWFSADGQEDRKVIRFLKHRPGVILTK